MTRRFAALFILVAATTGCTPAETILMTGVDVVSYAETGRTVTGHVTHAIWKKDCSAIHLVREGKLCIDDEPKPAQVVEAYCYRTLGAVTCHAVPDPYAGDGRRVH